MADYGHYVVLVGIVGYDETSGLFDKELTSLHV